MEIRRKVKGPVVFTGLFGHGQAIVVDLPSKFDLIRELRNARKIKIATAFAHWSGWRHLRPSLLTTPASVRLLTGLCFCQTEPRVLSDWWKLSRNPRTEARLFTQKGVTFHPKVLIVENPRHRFVIVGSGNLSDGGFLANVECSVFSSKVAVVAAVDQWFDELFGSNTATKQLLEADIRRYAPLYEKARSQNRKVKTLEDEIEEELRDSGRASLGKWRQATSLAIKFFSSQDFDEHYRQELDDVGPMIKEALDYPSFRFNKAGLDEFYRISTLGHIIAINKPQVWGERARLK